MAEANLKITIKNRQKQRSFITELREGPICNM